MNAQQSFHLVMLGLALCVFASLFSQAREKDKNAGIKQPDSSMTSAGFGQAPANRAIESQQAEGREGD